MKQKLYVVLLSVLSVTLLLSVPLITSAEEAVGNGGQIQTNGDVGFYEEATTTSATAKPAENFPSTGEMGQPTLGVIGLMIVSVSIFFWKQKRKNQGQVERS